MDTPVIGLWIGRRVNNHNNMPYTIPYAITNRYLFTKNGCGKIKLMDGNITAAKTPLIKWSNNMPT